MKKGKTHQIKRAQNNLRKRDKSNYRVKLEENIFKKWA